MSPLISVIIPVYNLVGYLRPSLESVLAQTYQHLEILLVDDGSTDGSLESVKDLVDCNERIKVFYQSNQGAAAARNKGIAESTGDYLFFMDGDDFLPPKALEVLHQALGDAGVKISIGGAEWEQVDGQTKRVVFEDRLYQLEELLYPSRQQWGGDAIMTVPWGKLYARSVFEQIKFPQGRLHEDEFTTYKLYLKAERAIGVSEIVYRYHYRAQSSSHVAVSVRHADALDAFREKAQLLEERGFDPTLSLLSFHYKLVDLWKRGQDQGNKELCRLMRQQYWFGFTRFSLERKMIEFLRFWVLLVRKGA